MHSRLNKRTLLGKRLLMINIARIGDTLMGTPLLSALKSSAPDAYVGCFAHPKRASVLEGLSSIDELRATTPKRLRFQGYVHGTRWDTAFVLGHEPVLVRYALRVADHVVAYRQKDEDLNRRLWRIVDIPRQRLHYVKERLLLAEAAGIATGELGLDYSVLPEEASWAEQWLQQQGIMENQPLIVLQLASFPTKPYRDWPLEHFMRLAGELRKRYPKAVFLLNGGKESRLRAASFTAAFPNCAINVTGKLPLRRSAALLQKADLYIGVDTGPTHLAGALGVPMVAMYHCRHPGRLFAPPEARWRRILEHPLSERGCSSETSMSEIGVEEVLGAALDLLAK